ncbi:DUF6415 family natural product biosynthesis protein [Streptomyces rishiriensis]|uniref:DUF6415 family natural product biosynthesis protein n=1 Tax=Streptomyces rishiriensis TaxID=68264 RepID=UPI0037D5F2BE
MHLVIVPPLPPAPVDAELIRQTCKTVIWHEVAATEHARTDSLLHGFLGLLLPAVGAGLAKLRGEWASTARHVITRVEGVLTGPESEHTTEHLREMAMLCRALLTLHERITPGTDTVRICRAR